MLEIVGRTAPLEEAGLYLRVSSDHQEENTSLESQEAAGRRWCAEHGYNLGASHVWREVHTGVELYERDVLRSAREALKRREIDVLVVYSLDRLSREPDHWTVLFTEAEHVGGRFEFVSEENDDSPEGQLLRYNRAYAAKSEHTKFRERSMRGHRTRAERGQLLPSNRPLYGYAWADETKGRYVVAPERAAVVRRMVGMYLDVSGSVRSIAATLNKERVPSPKGDRPWQPETVRYLLSHPAYIGQAFAFRSKTTKERSTTDPTRKVIRCELRPPDEWHELPEGTIPRILDPMAFAAVQDKLAVKGSRPGTGRLPADPEAALLRGGYARCGYCGSSLRASRPGGKRKVANVRYQCGERSRVHKPCPGGNFSINAAILDPAVRSWIAQILTRSEVNLERLAHIPGNDPTAGDLEAVDHALADVRRRQGNLAASLEHLHPDAAGLVVANLNRLSEQAERLEADREQILGRRRAWEAARERLVDLETWCRRLGEKVGDLDYERARLAVQALKITARVWGSHHQPRYVIEASLSLAESPETD